MWPGGGFGRGFYGGGGGPGYGQRRGYGGGGFAMLLLMQLLAQAAQMPIKPPVTLALMIGQIAIFFMPNLLKPFLPWGVSAADIGSVCMIPERVLSHRESWRAVASMFIHASDWHLYYNMASLLWKGAQLEQAMGSLAFAIMVRATV